MAQLETLTVKEIIKKINAQETFEAVSFEKSLHIKIRDYVPFLCAAVHAGNHLRINLRDKIIHNDYERWYEEDPHTDTFISSMPLTIISFKIDFSSKKFLFKKFFKKTIK